MATQLNEKTENLEKLRARGGTEQARSIFGARRAQQLGRTLNDEVITRLAWQDYEQRDVYSGSDPFTDDGRVPVYHDGFPENHPMTETQRCRVEEKKKSKVRLPSFMRRKRDHQLKDEAKEEPPELERQRPAEVDWNFRRWNDGSIDPAVLQSRQVATVKHSMSATQRLSSNLANLDRQLSVAMLQEDVAETPQKMDEKLHTELEKRLWHVFQGIIAEGRRVARKGRILNRSEEERALAEPKGYQNHKEELKVIARREAMKQQKILYHSNRFYFGDTREEPDDIPKGRLLPEVDRNICGMEDDNFARLVADYRQLAMDAVSRCAMPEYGRNINPDIYNEAIFQCDLAAAFRSHGIPVTLAEVDALWRDIIDEARRENPPDFSALSTIVKHMVKTKHHHRGGHHQPSGGGDGDQKGPNSWKWSSREALSVKESLAVALQDPVVKYDIMTCADFLTWQRSRHPLLRVRSDYDRENLHLLGRLVPSDVFYANFDFLIPMLEKLHTIRLRNNALGDHRPLLLQLNSACVETCDQPCRCELLFDSHGSPATSSQTSSSFGGWGCCGSSSS